MAAFTYLVALWCAAGESPAQSGRSEQLYYRRMVGETIHDVIAWDYPERALSMLEKNPSLVHSLNRNRETPLHVAAAYNNAEVVLWLLDHGAAPNAKAYNDFTPLHLTTNGAIAKLIITHGANLAQIDAWGKTSLQLAAEMGHGHLADAILESGYPIDLLSALLLDRRDDAKRILRENPSAAQPPQRMADLWANITPLGIAVAKNDKELVEMLLEAGAHVDSGTDRPNVGTLTPLCNAVWAGNVDLTQLLCQKGANCNVPGGKFYGSIVDYAIKARKFRIAGILLVHGAWPPGYLVAAVLIPLLFACLLIASRVWRNKTSMGRAGKS